MSKLSLLSPRDPELVQKTLSRLEQQDQWNDVFATKLFELLDNRDRFEQSIRKQLLLSADLDRIEAAVDRAELAWTTVDAARAELPHALQSLSEARTTLRQAVADSASARTAMGAAATAGQQAAARFGASQAEAQQARVLMDRAQGRWEASLSALESARTWWMRAFWTGVAGCTAPLVCLRLFGPGSIHAVWSLAVFGGAGCGFAAFAALRHGLPAR